jgi:hypothetical protein
VDNALSRIRSPPQSREQAATAELPISDPSISCIHLFALIEQESAAMAKRRSKRAARSEEARSEGVMSLEYLLVVFPDERAVLADGDKVGFTNHTLMLPANEYEIALDGGGTKPKSKTVTLAGTSVVRPMVVSFAPA